MFNGCSKLEVVLIDNEDSKIEEQLPDNSAGKQEPHKWIYKGDGYYFEIPQP